MGPQGYTGPTGPTGMAGPNVILASSVWKAGTLMAHHGRPSAVGAEEFMPYDIAASYTLIPADVSGMSSSILNPVTRRSQPGDFEPEKLKDKKLVIRGYDSSTCADPNVYLMQASI